MSQIRTGSIEWEMEENFGIDADKNGMMDLPNTKQYASNDEFMVFFQFKHTPPTNSELGVSYGNVNRHLTAYWYINGKLSKEIRNPAGTPDTFNIRLKDDHTYGVFARFEYKYDRTTIIHKSAEISVRPNNILIVALGDSYSSGEGNPDWPYTKSSWTKDKIWADGSKEHTGSIIHPVLKIPASNSTDKDHEIAHRSTTVWSAQAAASLEYSDKHTSITYVNLASGGARIENLINKNQTKSSDSNTRGMHTYIQVTEAKRLIGNRKIDALVLSIGGNDAGFDLAIMSYLVRNGDQLINLLTLDGIRNKIMNGKWEDGIGTDIVEIIPQVKFEERIGLAALPMSYLLLAEHIRLNLPKIENIYMLQYPDPTIGCIEILEVIPSSIAPNTGILKMDFEEINHAKVNLITPINKIIQNHCQIVGWELVDPGDWTGHGYCFKSKEPFFFQGFHSHYGLNPQFDPNIKDVGWVRTFIESFLLSKFALGVAHPNSWGHRAISLSLLKSLKPENNLSACSGDHFLRAREEIKMDKSCFQKADKDECYIWTAGEAIILEEGFDSEVGTVFEGVIDTKLKN
ncbi:MAG: SGNH/GDSL hydrolase family protein [Bacteroidota bacterium]